MAPLVAMEPPSDRPTRLAEAFAILAARQSTPIAGGTDLMVGLHAGVAEPPAHVLDLSALDALRGIALERDALVLGALTTYAEIRRSPICRARAPALVEAAATIGAAQIQNRGTIGGNLGTASPAGDTLPVLLATDATIVLGSHREEREVASRDYFSGYRTTARRPDELILRVRIPIVPGREVRYRKVGTRRAQAISKVAISLAWRDHGHAAGWSDVRVALGSVAPTPIRASATEASLEGARPTPEVADRAAVVLASEIAPIDDVRSTAEYRRVVAARVLHRLLRDAGGW